MVNSLFNNELYNLKLLENTNQYSLNQFYLTANEKLHDIFISALDNMKKRKIINWEGKVTIVPVNGSEYTASETELGLIKEIEALALNEFECANTFDINRKGIRKKYFSKCNELARKKYQWDGYYKLIYIELINHDIIDIWEDKIHDNKMKLNSQVVNGINSAIKAKVERAEKKYNFWEDNWFSEYLEESMEDGDCCIPDMPFKYDKNYYEVQTDLLYKLIKLQDLENETTSDNKIDWDSFINLDN